MDEENIKIDEQSKALEQEKSELTQLIQKGISFDVDDIEIQKKPIIFGLFKKRVPVTITRNFSIKEPTCAVLDRIAAETIEMAIDENKMRGDDAVKIAKILAEKHAIRCARIVAIATLGEDSFVRKVCKSGFAQYRENTESIEELTQLFAHNLKPSMLLNLFSLIQAISNYGDFVNSIRLVSTDRSTMPIRIEENEGV